MTFRPLKLLSALLISLALAFPVGQAVAQSSPGVADVQAEPVEAAIALPILKQRRLVPTPMTSLKSQAFSSFAVTSQSSGTAGINASEGAEITELARALRNDPDLIFEFVRNEIALDFTFGAKKGAVGALLDRSGNTFDQAELMVELLRASGYTASYVLGERRLFPSDIAEVFDITTSDPTTVSTFISSSGSPSTTFTTDGEVVYVDLTLVWVKVQIGGTDYVFDPTYVPQDFTAGIDIPAAIGYTQSTFLSGALSGATETADYVQNVNRANVRADLDGYATNLVDYIRTNAPGAKLEDIIGGSTPQPLSAPQRVTSLPNQMAIFDTWTVDIPVAYQTLFGIQLPGISLTTFDSRDVYGKRLTVFYDALNQPVLRLNGAVIATGAAGATGSTQDLIVSVDHPYASSNGTFADETGSVQRLKVGGSHYLVNAWGSSGRGIVEKHRKRLSEYRYGGLSESSEEVLGESLALIGQNWLLESLMSAQISGSLMRVPSRFHHRFGIVGQGDAPFVDLTGNISSTTSLDPNGLDEQVAAFLANTNRNSAFEHATIEQTQPSQAASTVKMLDIANINGERIYEATAANFASIRGLLTGYDTATLDQIQLDVDAGSRYILSENGSQTVDSWTGHGRILLRPDLGITGGAAYIIDGNLKGGRQTTGGVVQSEEIERALTTQEEARANPQTGDPIDFATGDFLAFNNDISIGSGPAPIGLSLSRSYNSRNRLQDKGLGLGWTHSFDISAEAGSSGYQGLGEDSPIDAAAAIAAIYVGLDILIGDQTKDQLVIMATVDRWFTDQLTDNVVTLQRPGSGGQFVKLPDGSYNPPPAVAATLSQSAGLYSILTADGVAIDFDSAGKISLLQDPNGNQTNFAYDGTDGRLLSVSNSVGRSFTFSYDASNRISGVSDGTGRTVSYGYDAVGNLVTFTDAEQQDITYGYDIDGRMTEIFYPAFPFDPIVSNTYDSLDRVKDQANAAGNSYQYFFAGSRSEEVDPLGNSKVAYFDAQGNTIRQINQVGDETVSTYDGQRRPVDRTLPEGNRIAFEYDANHNIERVTSHPKPGSSELPIVQQFTYGTAFNRLTSQTDALGRMTDYFYDAKGNLERAEFPDVDGVTPTRSFTYNLAGQVVTNTGPDGLVTRFVYDPANGNLLDSIHDDLGLQITSILGYDAVGNVTSATDPNGNQTTALYDNQRRPTLGTSATPLNFETRTAYFPDGKVEKVERETGDPLNPWQVTQFTYRISGERASVIDPEWDTTTFEYDELERLVATTDAELRISEIDYDPAGRLKRVYRTIGGFLTEVETYEYTANGLRRAAIDGIGGRTEFVYDDFDRLRQTVYDDMTFEQWDYDVAGNLLQRTTRADEVITFTYDPLNRLETKTLPGPVVHDYDYDLAGRPLLVTTPDGNFDYGYDTGGRLTSTTDAKLRTLGYDYDAAGNRTRLDYPDLDGFFVTYDYDEMNRLKSVKDSGTTELAGYAYDPLSRLASLTYGNGAGMTFGWELDDDLKQVAQTFPGGASVTYDYLHNAVGQKISQTVSDDTFLWRPDADETTAYTPTSLNTYESVDGQIYDYDANGSLTDDGASTYFYDAENRLTQVTQGATVASYKFDPFGRRAERDVNGTRTEFLYDGPNVIGEYDDLGNLTHRYVQGPGLDRPILLEQGAARSFYHFDGVGSVVALTGAAGFAVETYAYGPFGESANAASGNPYRYTARRYDAETGLYHYRNRAYSVALGRFLQPDPVGFGDGLNLYAYVGNDPLNFVDPLGLGREGSGTLSDAITDYGSGALDFYTSGRCLEECFGISYFTGTGTGTLNHGLAGLVEAGGPVFDPGVYASVQGIPGLGQAGTAVGAAARGLNFYAAGIRATQAKRAIDAAKAAAAANPARSGSTSALLTRDGQFFIGNSTRAGGPGHPTNSLVQSTLDTVPNTSRSPYHGCCSEVNAVSNAANAGARVEGGYIAPVRTSNGTSIPPCPSCKIMLDKLGVTAVP